MKKFLFTVLAIGSLGISNTQAAVTPAATPVIKVTLLGTGVPLLNPQALAKGGRALSGLLVEAGTEKMLFDCGQGVYTRLVQSGGSMISPNIGVDKVFISHLHSDHIADLGPLFSIGALYRYKKPTDGAANNPLRVWGPGSGPNQPVATWAMMQAFRVAYQTDFHVRQLFTNPNDFSVTDDAVETMKSTTELKEGVVYSHGGVTVSAFLVDHNPMSPSYGFRVNYKGRSFVYSGDTTKSANVIKNASNVDLLVHEVYGYAREGGPEIYDYHTSPETAAEVFLEAKPKNVVYTHMVMPPGTSANDLIDRTRAAGYKGPLTPGQDLMVINVNSDATVTITPPVTTTASSKSITTSSAGVVTASTSSSSEIDINDVKATSDFMEISKYRQAQLKGNE